METVMRKNCILGKAFLVLLSLIFFPPFSPVSSLAYEKEISGLSSIMAAKIAKAQKKTVGVVDFTDLQGNVTELGRFLAEELSVAITGAAEGFEVVDRTHLKSILQEHKLALTGLIDPSTARKLGEITGIQALITGTITPFGDSVRLSVKVLDVATAKIIVATSGEIPKTKAIEELLTRGIPGEIAQPQPPYQGGPLPPGSQISKKVGNITVTMKKIVVSKGQAMVFLDFFNNSEGELRLASSGQTRPSLMDERGNLFRYKGDQGGLISTWDTKDWRSLNAKASNDVTLQFDPEERDLNTKDIGSNFEFSLNYSLYNPKDKSQSSHSVSFSDVKGQLPK